MNSESNGSWRRLPPERHDPHEFARDARKNRIVAVFAMVVMILAVGQLALVALSGLGVMNFSQVTLGILAGSVPVEILVTVRVVVMKVIETDK